MIEANKSNWRFSGVTIRKFSNSLPMLIEMTLSDRVRCLDHQQSMNPTYECRVIKRPSSKWSAYADCPTKRRFKLPPTKVNTGKVRKRESNLSVPSILHRSLSHRISCLRVRKEILTKSLRDRTKLNVIKIGNLDGMKNDLLLSLRTPARQLINLK